MRPRLGHFRTWTWCAAAYYQRIFLCQVRRGKRPVLKLVEELIAITNAWNNMSATYMKKAHKSLEETVAMEGEHTDWRKGHPAGELPNCAETSRVYFPKIRGFQHSQFYEKLCPPFPTPSLNYLAATLNHGMNIDGTIVRSN